jgi:hypothetical protein
LHTLMLVFVQKQARALTRSLTHSRLCSSRAPRPCTHSCCVQKRVRALARPLKHSRVCSSGAPRPCTHCAGTDAYVDMPTHTLTCAQQQGVTPLRTLAMNVDTGACAGTSTRTFMCRIRELRQYIPAHTHVCATAGRHVLAHAHAVRATGRCGCTSVHTLICVHQQGTCPCTLHILMLCAGMGACICTPQHTPVCAQHQGSTPLHTLILCANAEQHTLVDTHACAETGLCVGTPAYTLMCVQQQRTMPLDTPMQCAETRWRLHALVHTHVCAESGAR